MRKLRRSPSLRLRECLTLFAQEHQVRTKGPLSLVLVITRATKSKRPPFSSDDFLTTQGGQVAGLGKSAVQAILAEYGIARVLAEEGGRTSRGSIGKMQAYVECLNAMHAEGILDLPEIEKWWIDRIRDFFASQPFKIRVDSSRSLRRIVSELIEAAFARQRECPGTMVAGAIMQHLVGAKLDIAVPNVRLEHRGFSVADAPEGKKADFVIRDAAVHVTTAPSEALLRKCSANIAEGLRPIIVTTESGSQGAKALARNFDIADRIDVLEIEQFVATNVYEWSEFRQEGCPATIRQLVDNYNRIIDDCETDPSLKISVGEA